MRILKVLGLGLAVLSGSVLAALVDADVDWKEIDTPPPPAIRADRIIPVDMPSYVTLKFGVDPTTVTLGPDGVVRYVMVTTNASGSVNAMYEGIRCVSREFKTYARQGSSKQWSIVKDPEWRALDDNNISRHALALASQGACDGRAATASSTADILRALKNRPVTSGN